MNDSLDSTPLIFDIKRYAINDGPGIRIVIFFKGCNLHCAWCHNPEGQSPSPERMYAPATCLRCGICIPECPEAAISMDVDGTVTNHLICKVCGRCAEVCPAKAVEISGRTMSVTEIMREIEKERIFFDQSGGGVTFSGGEPLQHYEFLIRLLDECAARNIHRAVDTAGHINTGLLLDVARRTDLFLYDLKLVDSERHRAWTGVPNERILANLRALAEYGANINIRIPLIGGVNDDDDNLEASARFIASLAGEPKKINLLVYHKIAQTKYQKLGRASAFQLFPEPSRERQEQAEAIFEKYGLCATIGG